MEEHIKVLRRELLRLRRERKAWLEEEGLSLLERMDRADEVRDEAMLIASEFWKNQQNK